MASKILTIIDTQSGLALKRTEFSEMPETALYSEYIENTVQTIVYNEDGSVNRIEHRAIAGNGLVRSDTYTFTENSVTEVRTLASGASLTITTDYITMQTTVVYAAAE